MLKDQELRDAYLGHPGGSLNPVHVAGLKRVEKAVYLSIMQKLGVLFETGNVKTTDLTAEQLDAWSEEGWPGVASSIDDPEYFLESIQNVVDSL